MRQAPPVQVRCQGGGLWLAFQSLCAGLAAGAFVAWALMWLGMAPWLTALLALLAALLAAVFAAWAWRQEPTDLRWDGQVWQADGDSVGLDLMIDLGSWMLIRLHPNQGGPMRWLAVTSADAGSSLHAMRVALYARPPGANSKRWAAQKTAQIGAPPQGQP